MQPRTRGRAAAAWHEQVMTGPLNRMSEPPSNVSRRVHIAVHLSRGWGSVDRRATYSAADWAAAPYPVAQLVPGSGPAGIAEVALAALLALAAAAGAAEPAADLSG